MGRGIRFKAKDARAALCGDMGELAGVGADIKNNAVGVQLDMPADAVFIRKLIDARVPAFAIKLPAHGRGRDDAAVVDDYLNAQGMGRHPDASMTADIQCGQCVLPEKLPSNFERQIQARGAFIDRHIA
jgi:hypothetical protein